MSSPLENPEGQNKARPKSRTGRGWQTEAGVRIGAADSFCRVAGKLSVSYIDAGSPRWAIG